MEKRSSKRMSNSASQPVTRLGTAAREESSAWLKRNRWGGLSALPRAGGIKIFNDLRPAVVGGRKVAVGVGLLTHKLFVAGEEKARGSYPDGWLWVVAQTYSWSVAERLWSRRPIKSGGPGLRDHDHQALSPIGQARLLGGLTIVQRLIKTVVGGIRSLSWVGCADSIRHQNPIGGGVICKPLLFFAGGIRSLS
ncbi:hypothetical protein P167DRAFT_574376 [Morchella conica CCBAS932]|uniref:Uncharacterized protein n=1 Tax=Morchella conica CCBAS932 TaxID=1392247 RepID=A0A3N4KP98_9PEZI|nr:hypothetical protein P167DRAFT_574376 [Morchella conica CCBAS932]